MCAIFILQHNKMHKHWGIWIVSKEMPLPHKFNSIKVSYYCQREQQANFSEPKYDAYCDYPTKRLTWGCCVFQKKLNFAWSTMLNLLFWTLSHRCEWLMVYKQCLISPACFFFYFKCTSIKKNINTLRHWMNTLNEFMDGPAFRCFAAETESIK